MAQKAFLFLFTLLVIHSADALCKGRQYGQGGKQLDETTALQNEKTCKALKSAGCVASAKCLWIPDKEGAVFLEGPTIKSVKHMQVGMMKDSEFKKAWEARSDVTESDKKEYAKVTDDFFKKNLRILTVGEDDIWYQQELTSFDATTKEFERVWKAAQPLIKAHKDKALQSKAKTSKPKVSKSKPDLHVSAIPQAQLVDFHGSGGSGGRRLITAGLVNGAHYANAPYSSFGMLKVRNTAYMGFAGGTIIRRRTNTFGHGGSVYVLLAAHDFVTNQLQPDGTRPLRQYAPLREYKFYPSLNGDEDARTALQAPNMLTTPSRVWILTTWDGRTGALDVAIAKFPVPDMRTFGYPAVGVAVDALIPNVAPPAATHDMIVYQQMNRALRTVGYQMYEARVPIYCVGNACQYDGVRIHKGYCGGPIFRTGSTNIVAMQVAREKINADGVSCDTAGATGEQNCRGLAVKISADLKTAIDGIADLITPALWRRYTNYPRAREAYDNVYLYTDSSAEEDDSEHATAALVPYFSDGRNSGYGQNVLDNHEAPDYGFDQFAGDSYSYRTYAYPENGGNSGALLMAIAAIFMSFLTVLVIACVLGLVATAGIGLYVFSGSEADKQTRLDAQESEIESNQL